MGAEVVDYSGKRFDTNIPSKRIISLAPDITELVFAAGAGQKLVGVARFSDYPASATSLPIIGDFSGIDMEKVLSLSPDLVIAWASGNRASDISQLSILGLRVFLIEPTNLQDIPALLRTLGLLTGTSLEAERSAVEFEEALHKLKSRVNRKLMVFYQIWNAPLLTINSRHIINDVVSRCGGINIFGDVDQLTPVVSSESVLMADPEVILISNSSLQNGKIEWQRHPRMQAVAANQIYEIAPDLIQRHTPRIIQGATQICQILSLAQSIDDK